ncbi:leucyl aminopeptidase family protein [Alkalihalobacillus oceani]|uniref:leucyl aminopeptidase family protein n=1 Tax=Halalkalibacter oceani TaxID=1653776 RepID=UPI00203F42CD|nr:leucyl aminopeptidase family protein [Halalkalibacter oceani]MCM3760444.1 leucyl aminopeptidase family protein [Halalkalibacter oceani]
MFYINETYESSSSEEVLVIGLFEKEGFVPAVNEIGPQLYEQLTGLKRKGRITAKQGACTVLYPSARQPAEVVYIIGLGARDDYPASSFQEAVAIAVKKARTDKLKRLALVAESFCPSTVTMERAAYLVGEAVALSAYERIDYKAKTNERDIHLEAITLITAETSLQQELERGFRFGEGVNLARRIANAPGNLLTIDDFIEEAQRIAERHRYQYDLLGRSELEKLALGAMVATAGAGDEAVKLLTLSYQGNPSSAETVALIGGGLVDGSSVERAGAAAVLAALEMIGSVRPAANILAVLPLAERRLGSPAIRQGNVIRTLSEKTIEIANEGAEEGLLLADGITYAKQLGATALIDVASFGGTIRSFTGEVMTGAMTNHPVLLERVQAAAEHTGEKMWCLPNEKQYRQLLAASDLADLSYPCRQAESIGNGLFLGEFAGSTPWVHLDIGGTALQSCPSPLQPKGATGVSARTLAYSIILH